MDIRSPRELVCQDPTVPTLPDIFIRIDDAINDPRCSLADISEIISGDAGLTARLLRLANSAFYNFPHPIDTITRAMTLVGTKQLRDLVLATTVIRAFQGVPVKQLDMRAFWEHSIAVGVGARILAGHLREANVEHFYVAGLLHDIGRLVLFMLLPEAMAEAVQHARRQPAPLHAVERALLGFDHADAGQALLEFWKLPAGLSEPISHHHHPRHTDCYPREAAILHLADVMVNGLGLGRSGNTYVPPLDGEAWESLQLSTGTLEMLLQQLELQFSAAVDIFLGGGS